MRTTFSFSKDFRQDDYRSCLEEVGAAIEELRKSCGCSVKPLMQALHIGHACTKGVYPAK